MTARLRARPNFSSDDEVAITVAPMALANCRAKIETPPVPRTSTLSPALSPPSATSARCISFDLSHPELYSKPITEDD